MKISDITKYIEDFAPLYLQESYDNAGLIIGNPENEVSAILITLDVTEQIIEEAIRKNANLIIAHHPIIFSPLKKITGKNHVERTVIKAIKNDIAIYAAHTNIDSLKQGLNGKIAEIIGLKDLKPLRSSNNQLRKIVTFVPDNYAAQVRQAMFEAGAGHIGNYDSCSYNTNGTGTFRAGENTNPFVGQKGKIHYEPEQRIETIVPVNLVNKTIQALISAHPYEEPAYDIYPIENKNENTGTGFIGELPEYIQTTAFMRMLIEKFGAQALKHTPIIKDKVKKIAICGGSGSFLLKDAIAAKCDVFVSADFKYHEFFDADGKIIIVDLGHYETEHVVIDFFYDFIIKKIPKFAVLKTEINTNPIKYLY